MVHMAAIPRKELKDRYFILSEREKSKKMFPVLKLVKYLNSDIIVAGFSL